MPTPNARKKLRRMEAFDSEPLWDRMTAHWREHPRLSENLPAILDDLVRHFDCTAGTIHVLDDSSGLLRLASQRGIPEVVIPKIESVPIGKGMAGIAAERREPVQVCNLQTDVSGVVRPGARETKMEGSVAVPMITQSGVLKGTLGIAKPVAYDFSPSECDLLLRIGSFIADHLPS